MKKYFTLFQYFFTLLMYFLGALLLAGALFFPVALTLFLWQKTQTAPQALRILALCSGFGFGYFLFGLCLAAETVVLRFALNLKLKEGEYPFFSSEAIKWAVVNAMMLIVNYTFMDFMKLTPLLPLYYQLMGAKVGRRVQINTKSLADVSLIEIGDDSVVGGDVVLIGHLAEHGKLKLKRTVIGKKVTIGLGAVIMPGVGIGDRALIAARAVLPKNTQVPENTLFAGMPAKYVRHLNQIAPEER